jgi:hypothetical protein
LSYPQPVWEQKISRKRPEQRVNQGYISSPMAGHLPYGFFAMTRGSNIGIVNSAGGAGPGAMPLPASREWSRWHPFDRFWQQQEWAADITGFAWSPDLRYL